MSISSRQSEILNLLIEEYIQTAKPVSSERMCQKGFDLSSATMRIELGHLNDDGYLYQPHISAGRVPTDKGYRFFVDSLREVKEELDLMEQLIEMRKSVVWELLSRLTRLISEEASTFVLGGVPERGVFFKEGWDEVLSEPEFERGDLGVEFARLVGSLQDRSENGYGELDVFIGSENPFGPSEEFSLVLSCCPMEDQRSILAIMGPKRMSYDKNIGLMKSVKKFLEHL